MALKISVSGEIVEADEFGLAVAVFKIDQLEKRLESVNGALENISNQSKAVGSGPKRMVSFLEGFRSMVKIEPHPKDSKRSLISIGGKQSYLKEIQLVLLKMRDAITDLIEIDQARISATKLTDPLERWMILDQLKPSYPLRYFDKLDWSEAMKHIQEVETDQESQNGSKISAMHKMKWSGRKNTLYYLLKVLTRETTKDGKPFLDATNVELANFIHANFEGMASLSTIEGEINKVLGSKKPKSQEVRAMDEIVKDAARLDSKLPKP